MFLRFALIVLALGFMPGQRTTTGVHADTPRVALLGFGKTETGLKMSDALASALMKDEIVRFVDRGLSSVAAAGVGYGGSLNMRLDEARDIGTAVGCDILIIGDAQTLRRSPSDGPIYYEAYATIFFVSARTGELIMWSRPSKQASTSAGAEKALIEEMSRSPVLYRLATFRWREAERNRDARAAANEEIVYEDAPDEGSPAAANFRPPQPFRRLHPPYTDTAAGAEAEATVDAQVEIGADGEVARVRIVRWAGFGLDESVADTIQRMHFRPATRDGASVPVRVLLRYNFRRPPKTK